MKSPNYITGNLLYADAPVIAHGVNTHGAFGAGIAGQIAHRWPEAAEQYRHATAHAHWLDNGMLISTLPDGRFLLHLKTQIRPGADARLHLINTAVFEAMDWCRESGLDTLAVPMLGCGIGGLDTHDVVQSYFALQMLFPTVQLDVYQYPNPQEQ